MRESGREGPPSPTRETGFRAIAEGRSRPRVSVFLLNRRVSSNVAGKIAERLPRCVADLDANADRGTPNNWVYLPPPLHMLPDDW